MDVDPNNATVTDPTEGSPRQRRRPRFRWFTAALVVVGVLGFAGVSCTPEEVAQIAVSNHFEAADQACALRIIERESGNDAGAINPYSGTIGLFQIHPTHTTWIRNTFGYGFNELIDANKNAEVARKLSDIAKIGYGDKWQPWRYGGQIIKNGGCPA